MAWYDDLAEVVRDRVHWTLEDGVATYRLEEPGWAAIVRATAMPPRPSGGGPSPGFATAPGLCNVKESRARAALMFREPAGHVGAPVGLCNQR
jgi:hypothetical protein